jgi:hypothetical protein
MNEVEDEIPYTRWRKNRERVRWLMRDGDPGALVPVCSEG